MAITLKRQLNDDEKAIVLNSHGRICFANGHTIPDGEPLHFDHIKAFSQGGQSELGNIAPMCGQHNKEKGTLSLFDFRTKLRLEQFFKEGDRLTLRDLLIYLKTNGDIFEFGLPISIQSEDKTISIESYNKKANYPIYKCPATGWDYFYATLDVNLLDSDDDEDQSVGLQPRYLISDKVFSLFRHFQLHPVLQPSIGRIVNNKIRLFDGQHKIAALLWVGRRSFECKIYLDPDLRLLNQTNIAAHDKYAQTRFYSSIMVLKLGSQFGHDFETYKNIEDGNPKTESDFMCWLRTSDGGSQTTAELNRRFQSYLFNAVLEHEENKLNRLVSRANRRTDETPITLDMLQKSLFTCFLYRDPVSDDLTTDAYKRELEVRNLAWLMGTLDDLAFSAWNSLPGGNPDNQRRLDRILRSKSMMAWSELLRDAICAKIDLHDADEKERPFYRALTDQEQQKIRTVCARLVGWKMWVSPENSQIDRVLSDNKRNVKQWFKENGLTTGYLMGAAE